MIGIYNISLTGKKEEEIIMSENEFLRQDLQNFLTAHQPSAPTKERKLHEPILLKEENNEDAGWKRLLLFPSLSPSELFARALLFFLFLHAGSGHL